MFTLLGVTGTGVLAAALLGAVTNAVNGRVCPAFFVHIWHAYWPARFTLWQAAIAQGILEGVLFGVAFSLLYGVGIGVITRARCGYRDAIRPLGWIALGALACWTLGGFAGVGVVVWNPDWYRWLAPDAPWFRGDMLAEGWVLGSIWGIESGGLVSTVLGLLLFARKWRRRTGGRER